MALVVCEVRPSLNAAIKKKTDLTVRRHPPSRNGKHYTALRFGRI